MAKNVGKLLLDGIQKWGNGDVEMAMIPISVAVDSTAKAEYPNVKRNEMRYKAFLSDNISLITFVGFGGMIRCKSSPFVGLSNYGDVETVLYKAVRCGVIHEGELASDVTFGHGFDNSDRDCLQLPNYLACGLILAVVVSPANTNQSLSEDLCLNLSGNLMGQSVRVNEFWGKKRELCELVGLG
jgi:hypothetical protein